MLFRSISIGAINSPNGGTREWRVTKDVAKKMLAFRRQPANDFERCVLASYVTFLDEMLAGLSPDTPQYWKRRQEVLEILLRQIQKEEEAQNDHR